MWLTLCVTGIGDLDGRETKIGRKRHPRFWQRVMQVSHTPLTAEGKPRPHHDSGVRGLMTVHLPIGPVLEIADRELPQEWIGIDELFTRCPAGRVGACHE